MKVPLWAAELAGEFWIAAKVIEPFPRNLRDPIARGVPLAVIPLPNLGIASVRHWLRAFEISCTIQGRDRPLQACLVACDDCGFAFFDPGDSESEQRFSVAHELAHFLRDYQYPRRKVVERLGPAILKVLDGVRLPTPEERLDALLRSVPLGFHVHLLERDREGNPATRRIAEAEECADRLAFELLAPAQEVMVTLNNSLQTTNIQVLEELLIERFGLPDAQAMNYAQILLPLKRRDPLLLRLTDRDAEAAAVRRQR